MRIGIDLGGSHIGIGLVDHINGKIVDKVEQDIKICDNMEEHILQLIDSYISNFLKKYSIDMIGIATPGDPSRQEMAIYNLVNLGIQKLEFKNIYEKYGIPIQIKNDAKAAGLAEYRFGSIKGKKDAVFLCLGTGIGSAVFLNGSLLQANRHVGFELGHMIIDKNGLKCNCGKDGCFETYCSMKRFKDNAKKILNTDENDSRKLLEYIKEIINNSKKLSNDNTEYNEIILEMDGLIDEYIDNMVIGLSNIIDIFEPEAICLGGSFVFYKDIFYKKLINEMNERKYVFNKENLPEIVLANLNNDAGIIGSVLD